VQNFAENIAMLLFVGGYSVAAAAGVPVAMSITGFGVILVVVIGTLSAYRFKRVP
jgi:hypothetical protein